MNAACKSKDKYLDALQVSINQNCLFQKPFFKSVVENVKRKQPLTILLPYDPSIKIKKDLLKGLKEYQLLLNLLQAAILEYDAEKLEKFDPIVGENACQVRAVKIALLFAKNSIDFSKIQTQIKEKNQIIEKLLSENYINFLMQAELSLKKVLEKENLHIQLTSEELFILKSFILTETKISHSSEELFHFQVNVFGKNDPLHSIDNACLGSIKREIIYPKILKKYGKVSSKFTEKLVRKLRKLLSKNSVDFLKSIIVNNNEKSLIDILSSRFTTRYLNCYCLPMFWSYKALFIILQKERIPVIIHAKFIDKKNEDYKVIDEEFLLYENDNDLKIHSYSANLKNTSNFNKSAVVIQGIVYQNYDENFKNNWIKLMKKSSIKNAILSGAADHRQYPHQEQEHLMNELKDEEYNYYKTMANEKGFSLKNPSTFFIQHVYASKNFCENKINQI